jgi:hypothetical protein
VTKKEQAKLHATQRSTGFKIEQAKAEMKDLNHPMLSCVRNPCGLWCCTLIVLDRCAALFNVCLSLLSV